MEKVKGTKNEYKQVHTDDYILEDGQHEGIVSEELWQKVHAKQAQERFVRLIEGMKQAQGITERLKEENALEWIGQLNNIRACAREVVNEEIIYS